MKTVKYNECLECKTIIFSNLEWPSRDINIPWWSVMSFTNEDYLPSFEELDVPDLQVTSSVLRASGVYFGKYCDNISKVNLFEIIW